MNLSTSAIAKKIDADIAEVFSALSNEKWILRKDNKWELTDIGKSKGGSIYNDYVVWPDSIANEIKELVTLEDKKLLLVSKISEKLSIEPQKLNLIFLELGWIEKDIRGWEVTKLGKTIGGKQREHAESGKLYVMWSENILNNNILKERISGQEDSSSTKQLEANEKGFRDKYPADFRSQDGHFVRSRAELLIDNYLYINQIVHAYERKVPIEEELYCDFYIPLGKKVYIEYWGKQGDEKYEKRKEIKKELYTKNGFGLIELQPDDINNLDDILPGKLLKYEIKGI